MTGEESPEQIALRANRLGLPTDQLRLMAETDVDAILASAESLKPKILVVDSIQVVHSETLTSAPGSVSQVRDCAAQLTRYAKQTGTILILVGHVTKDGSLAGPKVLEHMIDCSILLEGDHDSRYRTLRGQKNRFGAVNELGIFAMTDTGMREVTNPSAIFLDRSEHTAPGTTVVVGVPASAVLSKVASVSPGLAANDVEAVSKFSIALRRRSGGVRSRRLRRGPSG